MHATPPSMPEPSTPGKSTRSALREAALSRWDNEGGSLPDPVQDELFADQDLALSTHTTIAEWVHLRTRLIAMENVLIALLAEAPASQRELVREMAACIAPRPGAEAHPLTTRAALQMNQLVDRAEHLCG
jgi:hypothetical protein